MKRALAAAVLLLFACRGRESAPPPPPPAALPSDAAERSSLTDLTRGAVVVWRSGEALLENSAIAAIDGELGSYWANMPNDYPQSLVVALGAPARIERVGIRSFGKPFFVPKETTFESSKDGVAFQPLATLHPTPSPDPQWVDVRPTDAAFLRVTLVAPTVDHGQVCMASLLVQGRELAPARPGSIAGTWRINGRDAEFSSDARGAMQYAHSTLFFEGGSNGRFYRYEWIRDAEFGYAALTVTPDGKHLNGIQWHEEIAGLYFGDAWFGERADGHVAAPAADVAHEFLRRSGHHSLYNLRFGADDTLDTAASAEGLKWLVDELRRQPHPRLVAHEFREKTPEANRARAQRALDSLAKALQNAGVELRRVALVAAGSDNPRQIPGSEAARELYSTIDLEVGR
ncbi:MAG TPA: discoidin domain-containing protein [Thermoanaerobaculia bacterium]|nr:discoidin domain-containing protein [Thermoanaerobaculia bacterium]